ncbi:DUF998 domain-containing protein [Actinomadura sp. WMMB 499]|uniref:DUF998 domain-containing protein n=1 Tax=Actinomadura sp. WMMB 499 TaxID=1219491 RepID=UPI001246E4FE|nr:DUF998 domain-containing protein [Actinomadura sp. WMMB 499]QFG22544.1 DUF998 domain-containing protein [Actinomadura sp. WMMB 499]
MVLIKDKETRSLLGCGIAVPVVFVGVILVEGALRPGYTWPHRFGSELALGERGWVMIANFIVTGLLVMGFAAGLRRALAGRDGATAAPVLAALFGCCMIVGGVFVTDPKPGYPEGAVVPAEPTLHGTIHDANPVPFYLTLIALVCVLARRFASEPGGRPWMWFSIVTAVAVPVTFALAASSYDMESGSGGFHGLWQRINLAIGLGWVAAVAVRYLRAPGLDDRTKARTNAAPSCPASPRA